MLTRPRLFLGALAAGLIPLLPAPATLAQSQPAAVTLADARVARSSVLLEQWHTPAYLDIWRQQLAKAITVPPGAGKEAESRLRDDWRSAVMASYDANAMLAEMRQALSQTMTLADLEAGIRFAETDVGRRIRKALEPPAVPPEDGASMARSQAAAAALAKKPGRQSLIRDINTAMNNVEATVAVIISFSLGSAIGATAALPQGSPQMDPADLVHMIEKGRPQMRAAIASYVEGRIASLFESVANDDLETYLQELTTPAGKAYVDASNRAFEVALRKQAITIGGAFARNMRAQQL